MSFRQWHCADQLITMSLIFLQCLNDTELALCWFCLGPAPFLLLVFLDELTRNSGWGSCMSAGFFFGCFWVC